LSTTLIKQLLESGVHFGHQTKRWNPKMKPFIFGERGGIYIIDLEQTAVKVKEACDFLRGLVSRGENVLFVGTKKQAQETIGFEAVRCGMPYVNRRWLGGVLTNFKTLRKRVNRLNELDKMKKDGTFDVLSKKEVSMLTKEMAKLYRNLGGVIEMSKLPEALFIIDPEKEKIAVLEANKLSIPIVALVDTDCNPEQISYIIPGNDDGVKSIKFISATVADSVIEGKQKSVEDKGSMEVKEDVIESEKIKDKKEELAIEEVEEKDEDSKEDE